MVCGWLVEMGIEMIWMREAYIDSVIGGGGENRRQ
jgi:hypothetical protein